MLRMPRFEVKAPETVAEVVEALRTPGARLVAGGTDLLPNVKHRIERPPTLVSLHRVAGMRRVTVDEDAGELRIGAGMRLSEIARDPLVTEHAPSLAEAAGVVAGPQIRNTGTLGGNVNLDTRCRWINQTEFWRGALGGCLKADGDVCHVVKKGRRCVAALSSDCVPVLVSLDGSIVLAGPEGERVLPVEDYFHADGVRHTNREDGEVTTELRVPLPDGPRATTYVKWRPRGSIDFPLVSVALRFDLDGGDERRIRLAKAVAGVLGARPRIVEGLDAVEGQRLGDPGVATRVAGVVHSQCKPLENVPYDAAYRRHLVRVLTRRAVERLGA